MVLATELLLMSQAVRNVIAVGQFNQLASAIETSGTLGMYTLRSSIEELQRAGHVSSDLHMDGVV